jgi:hypothetical protein
MLSRERAVVARAGTEGGIELRTTDALLSRHRFELSANRRISNHSAFEVPLEDGERASGPAHQTTR